MYGTGAIENSQYVLILFTEATARAAKLGHHQVLWLFGPNHELTEVGAMNIFVVYVNEQGGNKHNKLSHHHYLKQYKNMYDHAVNG